MKVILLVGPPCSGKSEWAEEYQKKNPDALILDRDKMRLMLTGKVHGIGQPMEDFICALIDVAIFTGLQMGKTIVVDQTNCKYEYIRKFVAYYGDAVEVKTFWEYYPILKKRNQMRAFETRTLPIPDKVMKRLINWYVQLVYNPEFKKIRKHA